MTQRLPRIIGHRGAGILAPENTLAAIAAAASMGLSWVEFDVRITKDGHCVLIHDETLDRTTNGQGAIADVSLEQLRGLDAGAWHSAEFSGEMIPTLEDAVESLSFYGMSANVEIKCHPDLARKTGVRVARQLDRIWPESLPLPVISCFEADALRGAREAAPQMERAWLVKEIPPHWRDVLQDLGSNALHCAASLVSAQDVQDAVRSDVSLRAYVVDTVETTASLFALGVESVFSDRPDRLLRDWTGTAP
ncbi:MAG: glycerophosphodiester phosphodiesterase [Hyphomicrobiales bacterium]|nr:glycerophosphodiester phosphodiesterase [Hyphomicrobiales bacterium]